MSHFTRNVRGTTVALAITACLTLGAANVAIAAATPALSDNPPTDSQQPVTDTWITTKVKAELATTDGVKSMDVKVDTVDGIVYLTGNVRSDIELKKAVAATKSVKGVKDVDDSGLKSAD